MAFSAKKINNSKVTSATEEECWFFKSIRQDSGVAAVQDIGGHTAKL